MYMVRLRLLTCLSLMIFTACGTNADVVSTAAVMPIIETIFISQKYLVSRLKHVKIRGEQRLIVDNLLITSIAPYSFYVYQLPRTTL